MLARGKGTKRVDQIRKGEVIISRKRGSEEAIEGRVRSIVKTIFKEGTAKLVTIPEAGLKVTPWHPIRINNSWCFPSDRADAKEEPCEAVYSFLLESEEHVSMNINGIECITLAHGIEGDPV